MTSRCSNNIKRTIDLSAGGKLCDKNAKESWALLEELALYDNESWNDPRDFAKSVKTNSLPQDVSSTSDRHLIELEDQVQRLMEAHHASKSSVQVNKIASSCEVNMYVELPLLFVYGEEGYRSNMILINVYGTIKLSKIDYIRQKQNNTRNEYLSGLYDAIMKDEPEEEDIMKPNAAKGDDHNIIVKAEEEVKEESKESDKETEGETEEEEEDDPKYFDTFPTRQAYIDPESPINEMSKLNYYWIMSGGLKSRRKPSNPEKISIFVGRVKGLNVFVGNFTYECDFVVLEDTTSVIDHYLGGMILGKPLLKGIGLVYDKR
ncbi:hypothetical protein Tco_0732990 [Tanacetum coccineum]